MSEHLDDLKMVAFHVHQGIQKYAATYQRITKEGASAKSVMKNLFGRGVPMSELLSDAEGLVPVWSSLDNELRYFTLRTQGEIDYDERVYVDVLRQYVDVILEAVHALVDRQRILAKPPVQWSAHQAASAKFEWALNQHVALENKLNSVRPWR